MLIVYDLDGTLIDTRWANLQAYEAAGVTPPDDFYMRDWRSWTTPDIHDAKARFFVETIVNNVHEFPLLDVARDQKATVLSNMSWRSFCVLKGHVDLSGMNVHVGLNPLAKIDQLKKLGRSGIYVDDSLSTCQLVQQMTSWQVLHAGRF